MHGCALHPKSTPKCALHPKSNEFSAGERTVRLCFRNITGQREENGFGVWLRWRQERREVHLGERSRWWGPAR